MVEVFQEFAIHNLLINDTQLRLNVASMGVSQVGIEGRCEEKQTGGAPSSAFYRMQPQI